MTEFTWMAELIDLMSYSFMQKALIAAAFTTILCAVAGTLVVINRMTFIAGGVSHASYGGIALALSLGLPAMLGAIGVAAAMGLLLGIVRQRDSGKADALTGAFWAAGMAFGVILGDLSTAYSVDYLGYLFGSILLVSNMELWGLGIFAVLGVVLVVKYYRLLVVCSTDQDYAKTLGIPVQKVNIILLVLLCMAVVMLMKVAGLIMVMALLSMPASIAETRAGSVAGMVAISGGVAFVGIFGGMVISTIYNLTPGAVIVGILTIFYLINLALVWRKTK